MAPRWTTRPLSITLTSSPTSTATRKFCSTSRIVTPVALISFRHSISAPTIAGARPLVGSSISRSSRGSTMARAIDSICFCPPESEPARDSQNFFSAGKKPKIQARRAVVERAFARAEHEVLLDGEVGEDRHRLGRVADAEARDVARREAIERRVPERDAALRGAPEAHDRCAASSSCRRRCGRAAWSSGRRGASKSTPCRMW